jgi:A/G-specific adenine glycosylase
MKTNRVSNNSSLFRHALLAWYDREARDLPWRRDPQPYAVWLSEIILQQTRVDQGLPYFERFLKAFPDVSALADADEGAVLKLWEGLGYYTRARNLHKAAQTVVEERGGAFPLTAADWQTLPGIGPYTARAIASIAFGEAVPVVDGNVKRVLARLDDVAASIDDRAVDKALWARAGRLLSPTRPGDFNQAMMELGARVCTPKQPVCATCPVAAHCRAYAHGTQAERPVRRPKKAVPHHEVVVAAIRRNGRYLIGRRPSKGLLGGLWEFPGGKVESGEDHVAALKREIREELGLEVEVGGLVASVRHAYSHFRITLSVYRCTSREGDPQPGIHTDLKWVRPAEFALYAFPKANQKFLDLL